MYNIPILNIFRPRSNTIEFIITIPTVYDENGVYEHAD